ncbi:hypothetical protein HZH68_012307 [Vespula germanica]|uniref:Uncharacterized protein n=1 Tax=Vespula germanica TaxID=30212 RepID=A0A834MWZ2_VESGE|nr:hypothetical protein HZH68_012307 [Vespula germanica]
MSSPRFSKSQFSARSEKVQTSQGPMVPLEKFTSELVKNPIFTSSSKRKEGIRKKKKEEEVEQESLFLSAMLRKRETCSRVSSNFPFSFLPPSLPPSSLDSPMEEGRRRTVSNSRTRTYLAPSRDRDSLLRPPSRSASYANPSSWVGHMPSETPSKMSTIDKRAAKIKISWIHSLLSEHDRIRRMLSNVLTYINSSRRMLQRDSKGLETPNVDRVPIKTE